ncbi:alpha/beta hydrolase [Albibacillus kandeliae]|uniref:alpha/beta hydrolase n=1 Tax=Albibacillus kandeliae TaxID=2174228 RepID=UPI000D697403|nr:alpha/beta-hydrolase family protein [Albibacillus kandeliae]
MSARNRAPRVSLLGIYLGGLLCALTFTPSMIPRPWLFQALLAGTTLAAGYGLGMLGLLLWRYLELPVMGQRLRHLIFWPVTLITAGRLGYYFWSSSDWQDESRALVGLPPLEESSYVLLFVVAVACCAVLLALGWLLARAIGLILGLSRRYIGRRYASVLLVAGFLALLVASVDGWLISRMISALDEVQAAIDTEDPEGAVPPSETTRSGGPGSFVAWDGLGYAGKLFVYEGPRGAEIAAFTGRPAKEPIRAYVGLRTSDEPEAAARLALDELIRAGAFERRVLVIASPTGTGWLENDGLAPLEVMLDGDTAIVGVQYSYLPSPMSLILEPDRAGTSARALFNVVHGHWRTLDPATRPALYLFGLSLGSLASENSISFSSIMGDPVQGAVWAGPTFRNPIWRNVASNRAEGSPAWSPVFEDSSLVRVLTPYSDEAGEDMAWGPLRIVYVVNPSDAISYFRESMWLVEPDWFRPPRGPDISDLFQWSPVVSLFQVAIDMQFGAVMPDGHGHNYALRDYARAWASVVGQDDWSDADTERLGPVVRTTVK